MAIHFNDTWEDLDDSVFFFDASVPSFTDRGAGTNQDLFPDAGVAIGDAVYFLCSGSRAQFSGLRVSVSTALVAAAINGVWEYPTRSGAGVWSWNALADVVDGTNSFQTAGQNDVTWTCPVDWHNASLPGPANKNYQFMVRFRITDLSGLSEGGAITRASTRMRSFEIVCESGTDATPATFDDIYNADVAGGWGVVTKNQNSFVFAAGLRLPAGYYLSSKKEVVTFLTNWNIRLDGVVRIGELYSGDKVRYGSTFIFNLLNRDFSTASVIGAANSYFYNSMFRCVFVTGSYTAQGFWGSPGVGTGVSVIDCYFENFRQMSFSSGPIGVLGVRSCSGNGGHLEGAGAVVAGFVAFATGYGWRLQHHATLRYRIHGADFSKVISAPVQAYLYNNDGNRQYAVDSNFGTFTYDKYVYWNSGSGTDNRFYITASALIRIVDADGNPISGVTAVLKDKDGTTLFSFQTNEDGYVGEDSGEMTGATASSISDTGKAWTQDQWRFREILITSGAGVGQRRYVPAQSGAPYTTLPIVPAFQTTPSANDRYVVIPYIDWLLLRPSAEESSAQLWSIYTDSNPYTLTLSKAGYETLEVKMDIRKALDVVWKLKPSVRVRKGVEGDVFVAVDADKGSDAKIVRVA